MEWWFFLKIIWTGLALVVSGLSVLILWRIRGVLSWKRSLKGELKALKETAREGPDSQKHGIQLITNRCQEVFRSYSPELGELRDIPQFITSIAACYHPEADRPELEITIGPFLRSLDKSLERFDYILQRPGFKRLQSLNIRNIRNSRDWYLRLSGYRLYQWYMRYRTWIRGLSRFRFVLFPDPLFWVTYLSHHLTILTLTKYLMADIYLFCGKLALEAYDKEVPPDEEEGEPDDLEKTLEDLEALEESREQFEYPEICEIRNRMLGNAALFKSDPGFAQWKDAVYDAAMVISKNHFPDSENPLEEAAIGPLLEKTHTWISDLSKGEEFPLINRFYKIRLSTLYRAKNLSDILLPKSVQNVIKKALKTYGWVRWPLTIYRWARKTSPWGIALQAGWIAGKKAALAHICGRTFDKACKELDSVYHQSRELRKR